MLSKNDLIIKSCEYTPICPIFFEIEDRSRLDHKIVASVDPEIFKSWTPEFIILVTSDDAWD